MTTPSRPSPRLAAPALALACSLLCAAGLGAQEAPDPLGAYVREAVENNLSLKQERIAFERSEAGVREARGLYLPSVSLDARYSRTSGVLNIGDLVNPAYATLNQLTGTNAFPTDIDARLPLAQETKLRVTQPLFVPQIRENHRIRRSLRELQGAQLQAAKRQLAADVQAAYLGYASAARVAEIYRSTLPLLDENLRVSESLVRNGRATPEVVLRARADRSETEQALAEAEEKADAARRYFNFLLGRQMDAPVEVLPDSAFDAAPRVSLEEAIARARSGREELAQTDAGIRAAEAQARLAGAARLPSVSVALDYGVQGNEYRFGADDDFAVASVVFSWSAFNGGQDGARRQQARLDADRVRARREEVERQVELQVRQAYRAAEVSRGAITTAGDRLAAAHRTYQLVERRYQEGIAPQIELVDARTAFTSAQLNLVLTRYAHAARRVELERAAALRDLDP